MIDDRHRTLPGGLEFLMGIDAQRGAERGDVVGRGNGAFRDGRTGVAAPLAGSADDDTGVDARFWLTVSWTVFQVVLFTVRVSMTVTVLETLRVSVRVSGTRVYVVT